MPFRTRDVLEQWVAGFLAEGHRVHGSIEVLDHVGEPGEDTGLVVVRLHNATTDVHLQPVAPGDPHWQVGLGTREDYLLLGPAELRALSDELALTAELCCYLERRSEQLLAESVVEALPGTMVDALPATASAGRRALAEASQIVA